MLGAIALTLMGFTLGLLGAGGALLTLPILTLLWGIPASDATGMSLFIIGSVSLAGALLEAKSGDLRLKRVLAIALPSLVTVALFRNVLVPALPKSFSWGEMHLTLDRALGLGFGVVVLAAAFAMMRARKESSQEPRLFQMVTRGVFVGAISGTFGAGGGFMIVPVLRRSLQFPMRQAIATSLGIITINSAVGVVAGLRTFPSGLWVKTLSATAIALIGMAVGKAFQSKIPTSALQKAFLALLLIVGIAMLAINASASSIE
jgi:uncharacterized membrane protein YfcA